MPKRLAIKAARTIAEQYGLRQVIVIAWDGDQTHVTTYGKTPLEADQAALGGDKLKAVLNWPEHLSGEVPTRVARLLRRLDELEKLIAPFCELERPSADDVSPLFSIRFDVADQLRGVARHARHCMGVLRRQANGHSGGWRSPRLVEGFQRSADECRGLVRKLRALDSVIAGAPPVTPSTSSDRSAMIEYYARAVVMPCSLRDLMRRLENLRGLFSAEAEEAITP